MGVHAIKVPDIGEGIAEVELVAWHVKPGDLVQEDQALADVMTDKANVEIPSPVQGTVLALGGEVGQVLSVGSELIRIEVAEQPKGTAFAPAAPAGPAASERPIASPTVRRRARELAIILSEVRGTGPGNRIMHGDLELHLARHAREQPRSTPTAPATAERDGEQAVPVIGVRRKIAQKMQESKRRIPHFTYVEEIDVTEAQALRARLNAKWGSKRARLSLLPFLVRAVALAVREFPQINARYDDAAGVVTRYGAVHLGIATQTASGLMVPVLRNAEARDLWANAAEIARLAEAARGGKATRAELTGSTITLSSLGALGGIASTPVINHPEVAIVGVNRIVERPVMRGGAVVPRQMMNLSSSFDHRVVDGVDAAQFVQALRGYLESPATLFID